MQLNYKQTGETGQPLIILHGVFGSLDNWLSISKILAEKGFKVYLIDQRNHGRSPHSDEFSFELLSADLHEFITLHEIKDPVLVGHSMGGKTVMKYAVTHPEVPAKIVVVDIAPKASVIDNDRILKGLNALDLPTIENRNEADRRLSEHVHSVAIRQFLLKNLYRKEDGTFDLRINLKVLTRDMQKIGEAITTASPVKIPALFMRGEKSDYVLDEDWDEIRRMFPSAVLDTIKEAGHWIHAEQPEAFLASLLKFLSDDD